MPDDLDTLNRFCRNMHRVIPGSLKDWITDQSSNTILISEENIYLLITLSYMKRYVCQCSLHSKSHSSHHSSAIMCYNIKQTSFASMVQAIGKQQCQFMPHDMGVIKYLSNTFPMDSLGSGNVCFCSV